MSKKKWIIVWFLTILLIPAIGVFNFIIDPFQQYRVKSFYPIYYYNERFQNAGFLKNYDYDACIIGTSLISNFDIQHVKTQFNSKKIIKFSISGGSAKEQAVTIKAAIKNNKKITRIIWGIDFFSFIGDIDRLEDPSFPFYLYDSDLLNDTKYLLSFSTVKSSIEAILNPVLIDSNNFRFNYNKMYEWQEDYKDKFTIKNVLDSFNYSKKNSKDKYFASLMLASYKRNYQLIFERNKNIKFYIIFPPYSILQYKIWKEQDSFSEILQFKKTLIQELSKYSNVEIYDFQIAKDITHDLTNYKDIMHYHQKINYLMIEMIQDKDFLIDKNTISQHIDTLRLHVEDFDLHEFK